MRGTELSRVHSGRTVRWVRGTRASRPSSRLCDVVTAWHLWDKSREPGRTKRPGGRPGSARMGSAAVQGLRCGLCAETAPCPPSKRGAERTLTASRPRGLPGSAHGFNTSCPHPLLQCEPRCQNLRGSQVQRLTYRVRRSPPPHTCPPPPRGPPAGGLPEVGGLCPTEALGWRRGRGGP